MVDEQSLCIETVTEARLDMMYDLYTWNSNESASDDDEANGLSKLLNTDLTCNHSLDQQVDHFIGCLEFNFASLSMCAMSAVLQS